MIFVLGIPKHVAESKWVSAIQPKARGWGVANKFKVEDLKLANKAQRKISQQQQH